MKAIIFKKWDSHYNHIIPQTFITFQKINKGYSFIEFSPKFPRYMKIYAFLGLKIIPKMQILLNLLIDFEGH